MSRKTWTYLLAALTLWCGTAGAAWSACKLQPIASIDIEFDEDGTVLLPVKVDGQDAWMTLQMSAGIPTIYRSAAKQLGLRFEGQFNLEMSWGGQKVTHKTQVKSLLVGTANFARWDLYVLPHDEPPPMYKGRPMIGGLTSQFMRPVDVELNLAGRKLNMFKQTTSCKGQQVYWGGEFTAVELYYDPAGLMVFPMEIDGKRVEAALRTDTSTSVISETVTRQYFGFGRDSPGVTTEPTPAGGERATYRAMALTAKGLAMNNVKIRLQDDLSRKCQPSTADRRSRAIGFNDCISVAPLSIGTDLLRRLRIYIASKEGRIYFTRAAAPVPAVGGDGPNDGAAPVPADGAAGQPGAAAPDPAAGAAAPAAADAAAAQ